MKTILIALTCLILPATCLFAQNAWAITTGSVEYEKSVNTFAVLRKTLGPNLQEFTQQLLLHDYQRHNCLAILMHRHKVFYKFRPTI